MLIDLPFKGDETALREMEHSELISIVTQHGTSLTKVQNRILTDSTKGRPSIIRPGKPVYKYVFERLVEGQSFRSAVNTTTCGTILIRVARFHLPSEPRLCPEPEAHCGERDYCQGLRGRAIDLEGGRGWNISLVGFAQSSELPRRISSQENAGRGRED